MSSPIPAVPRHPLATTIDAAEPPNDANWLAILQTHADRQELGWWDRLMTAFINDPVGSCYFEHRPTAQLVIIGSTQHTFYSAAVIANGAATNNPGSPDNLSGAFPAWSDALAIVCDPSTGNTYRTNAAGALQAAVAAAGITSIQSIVYCSGSGLFVIAGPGGTATTEIETSTDGVTWTARTNDATTTAGETYLETDGTNVLAVQYEPGTSCKQSWSSDGGLTWSTWTTMTTPSSQQIGNIRYDAVSGIWYGSGPENPGDNLVSNATPGASATWADLGSRPESGTDIYILPVNGVLLSGNYYSLDGGTNWRWLGMGQPQSATRVSRRDDIVGGRVRWDATTDVLSGLIARGVLGF